MIAKFIGRKLLSGMTFFDFIAGSTMGSIAGGFINHYFKGAPVSVFSLVVMGALLILTEKATLLSLPVRKMLSGEPLIVISNGKIVEENMKKARYNFDNLMSNLRQQGVFDFSTVEFAVLEPNGKLSVLQKSQDRPLTPGDIHLSTAYKGMPSILIREGKIVDRNLQKNNLDRQWLMHKLHEQGLTGPEEVFVALLQTDGVLYVDKNDRD